MVSPFLEKSYFEKKISIQAEFLRIFGRFANKG